MQIASSHSSVVILERENVIKVSKIYFARKEYDEIYSVLNLRANGPVFATQIVLKLYRASHSIPPRQHCSRPRSFASCADGRGNGFSARSDSKH